MNVRKKKEKSISIKSSLDKVLDIYEDKDILDHIPITFCSDIRYLKLWMMVCYQMKIMFIWWKMIG